MDVEGDVQRYAGRVFRRGWDRLDAKFLDRRYLSGGQVDSTDGQGGSIRLSIKGKSHRLKLPAVGGAVPVLVNSKRTEAAFDLSDPRIDAVGAVKDEEKAAKAASKKRFESKLNHEDGDSRAVAAGEAAARAEAKAASMSERSDDPSQLLEAMEAAEEARDHAEGEERKREA